MICRVVPVMILFLIASAGGLTSPAYADEATLAQLTGTRINTDWFRYVNPRFGLAVDIPTKGYRYDVPVNGSGLNLQSKLVTITLYAHFVSNVVPDATNNVQSSISQLFDDASGNVAKRRLG